MKDPIKDPVSGKNKIELDVCGVTLKILTTEDAVYIEEIAGYYEALFLGQFDKKPSQGIDLSQRLAMAGVMLADQLFKQKAEMAEKEAAFHQEVEKYKKGFEAQKQKAADAERKFLSAQKEFERDSREKTNLRRELENTKRLLDTAQKELKDYVENFE